MKLKLFLILAFLPVALFGQKVILTPDGSANSLKNNPGGLLIRNLLLIPQDSVPKNWKDQGYSSTVWLRTDGLLMKHDYATGTDIPVAAAGTQPSGSDSLPPIYSPTSPQTRINSQTGYVEVWDPLNKVWRFSAPAGSNVFSLPIFKTTGSSSYPFSELKGTELISVTIEGSTMAIGSQVYLSDSTLVIPAGFPAGQRVAVIYRLKVTGSEAVPASQIALNQATVFPGKRITTSGPNMGQLFDDENFVASSIIPVTVYDQVKIYKGSSAGTVAYFFDSTGACIGSQTGLSGSPVTPTLASGTTGVRMNVSSNKATRDADIKAFYVSSSGYAPFTFPQVTGRGIVSLAGDQVIAKGVEGQEHFLTDAAIIYSKSRNIRAPESARDSLFVYTDGRTGVGGTAVPSNYIMEEIRVDPAKTKMACFRGPGGPSVFGCFYNAQKKPLSSVSNTNLQFTFDIPPGAAYFRYNVSSKPARWSIDKAIMTLVYDSVAPTFTIGAHVPVGIGNMNFGDSWAGRTVAYSGMSITTRSYGNAVSGVPVMDSMSSYARLAFAELGMEIVYSGSIPGATYAKNPDSSLSYRTPISYSIDNMLAGADLYFCDGPTNDAAYDMSPFGNLYSDSAQLALHLPVPWDTSRTTFTGAVDYICKTMRVKNPGATCVMATIFPRWQAPYTDPNKKNGLGKTQKDYCDRQKIICAYYGVNVWDVQSAFPVWPYDPDSRNALTIDGTHFKAGRGIEVAKNAFKAYLKTLH